MENDFKLVSIITPIYNGEKFIDELAMSILSQTYPHWEWLIVDDCSTDGTYIKLQKLAREDTRIKVFKNDYNSKTFASRNRGLENSKGSFIAFVDADDLWHEEKLSIQVALMIKSNTPFSYTFFKQFREDRYDNGKVIETPPVATFDSIIRSNFIATSSVMINADLVGSFKMKDVYHDDFKLWLELLGRFPRAEAVNKVLMYYRLTPNSLSRNKIKSASKVFRIFTNSLGLSYFRARILFVKWALHTTKRYIFPNGSKSK